MHKISEYNSDLIKSDEYFEMVKAGLKAGSWKTRQANINLLSNLPNRRPFKFYLQMMGDNDSDVVRTAQGKW